jgi:hypothetical protein
MLVIEGTGYLKCWYCLNWYPLDEMCWDADFLDWVCVYPDCSPSR